MPISYRAWESYQMERKDIIFFSFCQRIHYFCALNNKTVMDQYFNYTVPASGKAFIGRKKDVESLAGIIGGGGSVAVYGEPKSGKKSLIEAALSLLQGPGTKVARVDLTGCRTNENFILRTLSAVASLFASQMHEYEEIASRYLSDSHIILEDDSYMGGTVGFFMGAPADADDFQKVLSLPYTLARERGCKLVVCYQHFQNANWDSDADVMLKTFERIIFEGDGSCSFVFTGDRLNAMKEIFEVKRYFWKDVIIFPMSDIPLTDVIEFVHRGFQNKGKVIERSIISDAVSALRCNMWHVNLFFFIVDHVSLGYVVARTIAEAMDFMMASQSGRFHSQMADLTDFQVSLLKAIIDGEKKLSSASIVERYSLNSSANVKRLKDALTKKEVVWFDQLDEPHIQDPLFELWLRRVYFAK